MSYPSARLDQVPLVDPEPFEVGRSANQPMTCGVGERFCIGPRLARLGLFVLLDELLHPFSELRT